ncbi:hypothetical protein GALMADRAFT_1228062 [Galerina marginata CBS 339.88]|uniref:Uncharacterized protein n=1 Tax=Galerina marginata (strain CBS 339.88) TaxID=685588 RepID=A0A067T7S3_GALM3|nr:hypothetical protein GALMADRAFT_1228062 [Galerina marginata CBS 339.88]
MNLRCWMKTCALNLLSLFTVYDDVRQVIEAPAVGGTLLLKSLICRHRKYLEMLVPMTMWHIYRAQDLSASWGFCLILVVRQTLEIMDEELLLERILVLGPVKFSLAYSIPMLATHVFYYTQMVISTNSPVEVFVQAVLLVLPEVLMLISKAQKMYRTTASSPTRLTLEANVSV